MVLVVVSNRSLVFPTLTMQIATGYGVLFCFSSSLFLGCGLVTVTELGFRLQIVRPELETAAKQGDSIPSGTIIRLQHMKTRKWLHSHLHASPITGNQEVSKLFFFLPTFRNGHWSIIICFCVLCLSGLLVIMNW